MNADVEGVKKRQKTSPFPASVNAITKISSSLLMPRETQFKHQPLTAIAAMSAINLRGPWSPAQLTVKWARLLPDRSEAS